MININDADRNDLYNDMLSIVIPVMNEEANIDLLIEALHQHIPGIDYEIIFVDDGSTDSTVTRILRYNDPRIRLIQFTRNYGQTAAMVAGIEAAIGKYIAILDGDLQNDPSDILPMLCKLTDEDLDIVTGVRETRRDHIIARKFPSFVANWLIRTLSGVHVKDYGCSLKVLRRDVAKNLDLYGELHRFIPILANMNGARIGSVVVKHRHRQFGSSKYGIGRTLKVLSDLVLLLFFTKYRQRPMHFFGGVGFTLMLLGCVIEGYLFGEKFFNGNNIGDRPLFFIGILFIITALQFITTGFIAELTMRTYYGAKKHTLYTVAARYHGGVKLTNSGYR